MSDPASLPPSSPSEPKIVSPRPQHSLALNDATLADREMPAGTGQPGMCECIGRYRVERVLGQGRFGLVYLAYDGQLERHVAVKTPHPNLISSAYDAAHYLSEARLVAGLAHPNIVPVYDVGSTEHFPYYIVSKFIDGLTLAEKLAQGRLRYSDAAKLTATIAEALHYAHKQCIVHRDVKPGNILIDRSGQPFVVDFGVALREQEAHDAGRYAGTPAYMSPEQVRGEGHRVDGRSDVFSLGVAFYEMLTGCRPFRGDTQGELLESIASREPKPLRQIDDQIPKELERICLRALSKRAAERYTTAKDLADDLRCFLERGSAAAAAGQPAPPEGPAAANLPARASDAAPPVEHAASARHPRIVPKGLRSFDEHDAEFFLELLPGPRDRNGLPDSIRFWKAQVEESDAEKTFSVGLAYGPSGCGKSSLVKAGLLPRLSETVTAIYVEATAQDTETRLLNGLRRKCADAPRTLSLKETLRELRCSHSLPLGRKVLIVLDQFEQWLHAKNEEQQSSLVEALRQCDGEHLQCIIMVRDDFWMAATRFMRELEVRVVEGHNSAAVDLFDQDHARKVLAAFGRAFGKLPRKPDDNSKDQHQFLDQAVAGLAEDEKIIPVRLALFAEMMKDKAWTTETLKKMGGTEGVGVTFLNETFSAKTAPPEHRYHKKAVRAVLSALLPESGWAIKGHMRSYFDLLEASGYAGRPADFDDLLRILDGELRLITPTDPAGRDAEEEPTARGRPGEKFYQLAHDYLVPSLWEWLTRQLKETRRGRAELLLADRAAVWNARPEPRRLPSLIEWLAISLLTTRRNWSPMQRKMMRQAGWRFAVRGSWLAVGSALLAGLGWQQLGRVRSEHKLETLLHSPTEDVPGVVRDMASHRRWLNAPLRRLLAEARRTNDQRGELHLAMALLPVDPGQSDYLLERLLNATPVEALAIRTSMQDRPGQADGRLWKLVADRNADSRGRLRAAVFLAGTAAGDRRWKAAAADIIDCLMTENALYRYEWIRALKPVSRTLIEPLAASVAKASGADELRKLAEAYAEFATGEPDGFRPLETALRADAAADQAQAGLAARQQANIAATLALAGQWSKVWPLLRQTSSPTLRTYLIERLGSMGVDTRAVEERLNQEPDGSIRRALALVLGDLGRSRLRLQDRQRIAQELLAWRRDADADDGFRAAVDWVLKHWQQLPDRSETDPQPSSVRLVVVSPGELTLSDASGASRTVGVPYRYALGACEVTIAEFLRFRPDHPFDKRSAQTDDCPVNEVSWYDAAAYCNWLSQETGISEDQWCYAPNAAGEYAPGMRVNANSLSLTGYRLPTSAEWEYACRAGSRSQLSIGDAAELLDRYAWSMSNSGVRSRPVASLRPNDWGLFDMYGNVWEWCHNRVSGQGAELAFEPGRDDVATDEFYRPLRGGTYLNDPEVIDSTSVIWTSPSSHTGADGFRVARSMP